MQALNHQRITVQEKILAKYPCGVPARQGGTDVERLAFPSPDAALGDGDSAARCSYL
jgi:hypothetical protein